MRISKTTGYAALSRQQAQDGDVKSAQATQTPENHQNHDVNISISETATISVAEINANGDYENQLATIENEIQWMKQQLGH